MKIKAAVIHEKNGPFSFEELELVDPSGDELMVKIMASGICHTDVFGRSQGVPIPLPLVLGHEGAGIVEKVGENAKGFAVGDHVAFSYAYCAHCSSCMTGQPYYCESFNAINFGGVSGDGKTKLFQNGKPVSMFFGQSSFATHAVVSAKSAVKVDNDVDFSIIAPMGCGIQTGAGAVINCIRPRISDSIAVFGCGSVGLSAIMAAKVCQCKTIIAVGGNAESLKLAMELGATHTVNRKEVASVCSAVNEMVPGGVDYSIDTSGHGPMIEHPASNTSWAEDHIAITGIMGIGREKANSLGGSFCSRFWIEEWGYPDIGVAICDCPSVGHDRIFLDYWQCGPQGEPMVVHVDQEGDYEITWLVDDFECFIRGLDSDERYEVDC